MLITLRGQRSRSGPALQSACHLLRGDENRNFFDCDGFCALCVCDRGYDKAGHDPFRHVDALAPSVGWFPHVFHAVLNSSSALQLPCTWNMGHPHNQRTTQTSAPGGDCRRPPARRRPSLPPATATMGPDNNTARALFECFFARRRVSGGLLELRRSPNRSRRLSNLNVRALNGLTLVGQGLGPAPCQDCASSLVDKRVEGSWFCGPES